MQSHDEKMLLEYCKEAKWDIIYHISSKNQFDGSFSENEVKDPEDVAFLNFVKSIDQAMEYYDEYREGNFEIDRFFGKIDKSIHDLPSINIFSVEKLLDLRKRLLEVYCSGRSLC